MSNINFNQNNLKNSKSLYLKQHENNKVNWQEYTKEAISFAKENNKLIFISIGYSSCHWCHVMNEESFENETVANFLNENYVCIKVDKEEMPHIDQYYQVGCQAITGRGGWPLSVFLTPNKETFFIGTYFPLNTQKNLPGFLDLSKNLHSTFRNDQKTIENNITEFKKAFSQKPAPNKEIQFEGHFPHPSGIINALKELQDNKNGGYQGKPKFPQFSFYTYAIEQMLEGQINQEIGTHIIKSIDGICFGGIHDHIRGGIHRYSVDEQWKIPHFEKMLYDQAGFLKLLVKTSLIYPTPMIFDSLMLTLDYLRKEMLSDSKYFFSGQDADSEGIEGFYYTYTLEEIKQVLTNNELTKDIDLSLIDNFFLFNEKGNFHDGLNVIALNANKKEEIFKPENWENIRKIKNVLKIDRQMRIPPKTDNKGIASHNFMLLSSIIDVIQYCSIPQIRELAKNILFENFDGICLKFIAQNEGSEEFKHTIIHSTSNETDFGLLEDYVSFCELNFRMYDISANKMFLDNGINTLSFIFEEFFKDGHFYTTKTKKENELIDNIVSPYYDQSFKSPVGTLIFLYRKYSLVDEKIKTINESLANFYEDMKYICLNSPIGFAEVIRGLTYPELAFKKLDIPKEFINDQEFIEFSKFLSSRFVFYFNEETKEDWQICSFSSCEFKGSGIKEFLEVFQEKK